MMGKVVFLNGPPGVGKDTVADHIADNVRKMLIYEMKDPMRQAISGFFALGDQEYEDLFLNRGAKDVCQPALLGAVPRQVLISFSEQWAKQQFGIRVLGHLAVERMGPMDDWNWIIPDSGFMYEAEPIIERFGIENCMLVHMYRPGHTFAGDSRSLWDGPEGLRTLALNNDSTIEALHQNAMDIIGGFIGDVRDTGPTDAGVPTSGEGSGAIE